MKKALITGITGQDGAYLAELLLSKGYEVHGIKRRSSLFNTERIDHLYKDTHVENNNFYMHFGDLTDSANLIKLVTDIRPDEIYNLAAQSHVAVSFDMPEYTADVDGTGVLRLLEAIRIAGLTKTCRFYQASTSELYGGLEYNRPMKGYTEESPMHPRSPYGCAKLYAMWITRNYKESYGIFACNGILFNHESPRRGETFVTRKITIAVAKIHLGIQDCLYLGNLDAIRDWGHAKDYVDAMWRILQQDTPDDYVISTGVAHTVRQFVEWSFEEVGIQIEWKGIGVEEKGYDKKTGKCVVSVDPRYFRPAEVDFLLGDSTKAQIELNWKPEYTVQSMCAEMVRSDIERAKKQQILKEHGYDIIHQYE